MATDIKAASVYASTEFRIDKKSWDHLDRFSKKIDQLKKKFGSLATATAAEGRKVEKSVKKMAKVEDFHSKRYKRDVKFAKHSSLKYKIDSLKLQGDAAEKASRAMSKLDAAFSEGRISASRYGTSVTNLIRNLSLDNKATKENMTLKKTQAKQAAKQAKEQMNLDDMIYAKRSTFKRRATGFGLDSDAVKGATRDFERLVQKLKAGSISTKRFNADVQNLTHSLKSQKVQVKGLNAHYRDLRRSMINLTAGYSLFAAGAGVANTGKAMQGTQTMFQTMFGAEGSADELAFLRQETDRLGINFLSSAKQYAKFSFSAQKAGLSLGEMREIYTSMSEAAVVFGTTTDDQEGIFKALTQMLSKGTVSMEELKQQLGDRLPGALNIAAEELGYTQDQLGQFLKDIEQGRVLAKDAVPAIAKGMKKMAAPGLAKALENLARKQERLVNAFDSFKVTIGESGFLDGLGFLYETLEEIFATVKPLAQFLGSAFKTVIYTVVGVIRVANAIIHDFLVVIRKIGEFFGVDDVVGKVAEFAGSFVGFGAAAFVITRLVKAFQWLKATWISLKESFGSGGGFIADAIGKVAPFIKGIKGDAATALTVGGTVAGASVAARMSQNNSNSQTLTQESKVTIQMSDEAKRKFDVVEDLGKQITQVDMATGE